MILAAMALLEITAVSAIAMILFMVLSPSEGLKVNFASCLFSGCLWLYNHHPADAQLTALAINCAFCPQGDAHQQRGNGQHDGDGFEIPAPV